MSDSMKMTQEQKSEQILTRFVKRTQQSGLRGVAIVLNGEKCEIGVAGFTVSDLPKFLDAVKAKSVEIFGGGNNEVSTL